MAVLQTLRNRAGLLVGAIGVAMFAFIATDLFQNRTGNSNETTVAVINGEAVDVQFYMKLAEKLENDRQANNRDRALDMAWDQIVSTIILGQEYGKIGLGVPVQRYGIIGVSEDEMNDLVVGENIAPQIKQIFTNPETGQYDRNRAQQFLQIKDEDPQRAAAWADIEKSVMQQRLYAKYSELITKGLYVTKFELERSLTDKSKKVDIDFIAVPYTTINDSTVTVSESEAKAYYNENKEDYKQDESREIQYVVYNVLPSSDDTATAKKWVDDLKKDFAISTNDEVFVNSNSDETFDPTYYAKGQFTSWLDTTLFDAVEGSMTDVYKSGNYFKLTKLSKVAYLPDSVKVQHILLNTQETAMKADSIMKAINDNGGSFEDACAKFSGDTKTKINGGDLGWIKTGQEFPKQFYDTCFNAKLNKVYAVYTQYAIHLIKVNEKSELIRKVKYATVASEIRPTKTTIDNVLAEAARFASKAKDKESFEATVEELKMNKRIASSLGKNDRSIPGFQNARQLIKWAYNAEVGDVSDVEEVEENFIVACVTDISADGYKSFESVKEEIEKKLINDKKAEKIIEKLKTAEASNLEAMAKATETNVRNASEVTFAMMTVPGIGRQPEVIGKAVALEEGQISDPISTNQNVCVVKVTKKYEAPKTSETMEKTSLASAMQSAFRYKLFESLKESGDIEDNRFFFQ